MSGKEIAVVIPTFNRVVELKRAIESVLIQTFPAKEIWIVDDASTENIEAVVKAFLCDKLFYYRLPVKSNANVARNKGADLASCEYIAFLDSDDEWLENHLENFIKHQDVKFEGYFSNGYVIRALNQPPLLKTSEDLKEFDSPMNFLFGGGFAQTSSYIISRLAFQKVKFDPTLKRHQDFDFFVRFFLSCTWRQLSEHTFKIHWEKGRQVNRSAADEMTFMRQYKHLLNPQLYKRYLAIQYDYFYENGNESDYQLHQKELFEILDFLSVSEFLAFYKEKKTKIEKFSLAVLFYLLKIKRFILRPLSKDRTFITKRI